MASIGSIIHVPAGSRHGCAWWSRAFGGSAEIILIKRCSSIHLRLIRTTCLDFSFSRCQIPTLLTWWVVEFQTFICQTSAQKISPPHYEMGQFATTQGRTCDDGMLILLQDPYTPRTQGLWSPREQSGYQAPLLWNHFLISPGDRHHLFF